MHANSNGINGPLRSSSGTNSAIRICPPGAERPERAFNEPSRPLGPFTVTDMAQYNHIETRSPKSIARRSPGQNVYRSGRTFSFNERTRDSIEHCWQVDRRHMASEHPVARERDSTPPSRRRHRAPASGHAACRRMLMCPPRSQRPRRSSSCRDSTSLEKNSASGRGPCTDLRALTRARRRTSGPTRTTILPYPAHYVCADVVGAGPHEKQRRGDNA